MSNRPERTIFYWRDACLYVAGALKQHYDYLSYRHRFFAMVPSDPKDPNSRPVKKPRSEVRALWFETEKPGLIMTYQGFISELVAINTKAGVPYDIRDERQNQLRHVPENLLEGLRPGGKELLRQALAYEQSGLIGAPTRYGKTGLIASTLNMYPDAPAVVAAPGVDLLGQLIQDLKQWIPHRDFKGMFTGVRKAQKGQGDDITVCSFDSLHKLDHRRTQLFLIDEPHMGASETRTEKVLQVPHARILGFGATLKGRFDGADKLITGLTGPVLAAKTFQDGVREGVLCPITVYMLKMPIQEQDAFYGNRDVAYRKLVYQNMYIFEVIEWLSNLIPEDWQTLVFIDQVLQGDLMTRMLSRPGTLAVAERLKTKERKEVFDKMQSGEIKRCFATKIFSTGVTFPDLRVIINATGGGGSTTSIQKPGRLAQVRDGKACGYMIDFKFEPPAGMDVLQMNEGSGFLVRDSEKRKAIYENIGYNVVELDYPWADIQLT